MVSQGFAGFRKGFAGFGFVCHEVCEGQQPKLCARGPCKCWQVTSAPSMPWPSRLMACWLPATRSLRFSAQGHFIAQHRAGFVAGGRDLCVEPHVQGKGPLTAAGPDARMLPEVDDCILESRC